jgi:hypothetical protein
LANQISPYSPFFKPLAYQAFLERSSHQADRLLLANFVEKAGSLAGGA